MRNAIALIVLGLLTGCVSVRDVTGDPNYSHCQGDYVRSACYRLSQPAAIGEFRPHGALPIFSPTPRFELFPVGGRDQNSGNVAVGTRLRFKSVLYHDYFENTTVIPVAEVLEGPWAGRRVGIADISRHDSALLEQRYNDQYFRDPAWLASCDAPDKSGTR
jgi:hypothetical protein